MPTAYMSRGRFLIKAVSFRQTPQAQKQQAHFQQGKWPMFRQFRQTFSTNHNNNSANTPKAAITHDPLVHRSAHSLSRGQNKHDLENQGQQPNQHSAWLRWTAFLLRWGPVGFIFYGAFYWQWHRQKCEREEHQRTASNLQAKIYCSLPLRILSRCWGWLAACHVPESLRPFIYGWYSNVFDVNLGEALYPDYTHYPSLAEFFTRPLRDGVRPIHATAPLVSPADGKVLHFGAANNSMVEQVKGVNYNIQTFLGPPTWTRRLIDKAELYGDDEDYGSVIKERRDGTTCLYQCVIYLAPGDYHRFHSPADWHPIIRRHFDGELLSVSPRVATWLPELFCLNERVLYVGQWEHGFFSYTAVGATNVGSVQIYMDDKLRTNRWVGLKVGTHKKTKQQLSYDELAFVETSVKSSKSMRMFKRGDLVGQFNMGSTIVLLFEAPKNFEFALEAGQIIRVGEPLGRFRPNNKK